MEDAVGGLYASVYLKCFLNYLNRTNKIVQPNRIAFNY